MSQQQYESALTKRLNEQIEHLRDEICAGLLPDYAAYRAKCAQIAAFKKAGTEFMDDVRKELAER